MKRICSLVLLLLAQGCYWARISKRSSIYTYVCQWPSHERHAEPLSCEPYEDWKGFSEENPPPETNTFIIKVAR